jgi:hypothetical protein
VNGVELRKDDSVSFTIPVTLEIVCGVNEFILTEVAQLVVNVNKNVVVP